MLTDAGMVAIVELHWTAAGSDKATGQKPMPDMDHSVDFWKSVAKFFMDNDKVIFELFNEPYPDSGQWNSTEGWRCFRDGGSCSGVNYQAAGMQTLLNAVRGTGAKNVILAGGLAWSNSLAQWLQYKPQDQLNNLAASWHSYNFNYCKEKSCWETSVGRVKAQYPVVASSGSMGGPGGAMAPPKFLPHNYSLVINATYDGMCGLALQKLALAGI